MVSASLIDPSRTAPKSSAVRIVEVGPRDGLQNIKKVISTGTKIELIKRLAACGNSTIEATSFVSPRWVPQLADGAAVLRGVQHLLNRSTLSLPVLVPNTAGLRRAIQSGVKEIAVFVSASEGFSKRNINCSIAESLQRAHEVVTQATKAGIRARGYVA